jgi:EAL domain-containing protein (putative c-di-GMP-specific phosphodiesterase class I)
VAVNVSSRQLLDNRFADYLESLLEEHQLPTRCIEIELTENVLQTGAATIEALKRLRAAGVAIALDDFGTGYSSLSSLELLPLSRVKLDRSLIASLDSSPRSLAISRGIIGLCRDLGLQVTAEGIEHTEQLSALTQYSTLTLQGYLISRPLDRDAVLPFLKAAPEHMHSLLLSMTEIMFKPRADANVVSFEESEQRLERELAARA